MNKRLIIFLFLLANVAVAQTLSASRAVNWKLAGVKDTSTQGFTVVDALSYGFVADSVTPNDYPLGSLMIAYKGPTILYLPAGNYLFNAPIYLRSDFIIRGAGANQTKLIINHPNTGHSIYASGYSSNDTTALTNTASKGSQQITVANVSAFKVGDWIQLKQNDSDLITSSWAKNSVGQIAQITAITGNAISLASEMRMDYALQRKPFIQKIVPVKNTGVECLSIERLDNTAPEQSSNINLDYTVNAWVKGVAFNNTTFAHIAASHCSNLSISHCYFKNAFDYGGGGRAYGVMLQFSTNECRVYNNIFKHLRHSMIVQAGANGNVFCYNYSIDPYWTGSTFLPSNSAGDMVLHGNYVFANLFEQNDGQNIVIDNSHGANGPYNTFFRNRASLWGIFFSDNTSPNQNFIGNEIPNTALPYSSVNYSLQGANHFVYGNNNKNVINPVGSNNLTDTSYCFAHKPNDMLSQYWAKIGTPNAMNSGKIQACEQYLRNEFTAGACGFSGTLNIESSKAETISLSPNPIQSAHEIVFNTNIYGIEVYDITGRLCYAQTFDTGIEHWQAELQPGCYTISLRTITNALSTHRLIIE